MVLNTTAPRDNAGKRARAGDPIDPEGLNKLVASQNTAADEQWEREWRLHRLRWALREVAPEFGQTLLAAFQMHVLNQVSVEETAQRLDMTKASVYQAKSRILRRVKEQLDATDPDSEF
jgi:DNA-directed RNA polymerase specialized sigma24 family protein